MDLNEEDRVAKKFTCPGCGKSIDFTASPYTQTASQPKTPRSTNVITLFPNLEGDEMTYVQGLIRDMGDNQAQQFASIYNSRRKDPQTILLVTLLGFLGIAGVQRFMVNQIGMGLLYLFTVGFCWIGTIIDVVNYKKLAFEENSKIAQNTAVMVRASA